MEIPTVEIEALCAYVEIDIENGVQMNQSDWRQSLEKVRKWLESAEQGVQPDGACPSCQQARHPVCLNLACPDCIIRVPRR